MIKVALTGNIASGKSSVQNYIEQAGFKVFCTDECAHSLLENNSDVYKLFDTNDRSEIAKVVFVHPEKLRALEDILHPLIKIKLQGFFEQNKAEKLVFAAVPLLFEARFENMFDKVILVSASYNLRLKRLIERNGYDLDYAKLRLDSQMNEKEKISRSDFVIVNDSTPEELEKRTAELLNFLKFNFIT